MRTRNSCFPVSLDRTRRDLRRPHGRRRPSHRDRRRPRRWPSMTTTFPTPQKGRPSKRPSHAMLHLHSDGRNHIWAYYTRNLVRPVALGQAKVDVIVGNPPWINYNADTVSTLRTELERQSKEDYGIWTGGRYATHQDVCRPLLRPQRRPLPEGQVALSEWSCLTAPCRLASTIPSGAPARGEQKLREATPHEGGAVRKRSNSWPRPCRSTSGYKTAWDLEEAGAQHLLPHPGVGGLREANLGLKSPRLCRWRADAERWLGGAGTERPT